jgi:hypothetical protein
LLRQWESDSPGEDDKVRCIFRQSPFVRPGPIGAQSRQRKRWAPP